MVAAEVENELGLLGLRIRDVNPEIIVACVLKLNGAAVGEKSVNGNLEVDVHLDTEAVIEVVVTAAAR